MAASATATRPTRQRRSDKPAEPPPPDSAPASEPAAQPSDQTTGIPPMETMPADIVSAICSIRQEVGAVRKDGEYKQGGTLQLPWRRRRGERALASHDPPRPRHGPRPREPDLLRRGPHPARGDPEARRGRGRLHRHGPGGGVLP